MAGLFDPIVAIRDLGGHLARLDDGRIELWFDIEAGEPARTKARRIYARYLDLLRLQFTVPAGDPPRTVQQLVAAGKVTVRGGTYTRVGRR